MVPKLYNLPFVCFLTIPSLFGQPNQRSTEWSLNIGSQHYQVNDEYFSPLTYDGFGPLLRLNAKVVRHHGNFGLNFSYGQASDMNSSLDLSLKGVEDRPAFLVRFFNPEICFGYERKLTEGRTSIYLGPAIYLYYGDLQVLTPSIFGLNLGLFNYSLGLSKSLDYNLSDKSTLHLETFASVLAVNHRHPNRFENEEQIFFLAEDLLDTKGEFSTLNHLQQVRVRLSYERKLGSKVLLGVGYNLSYSAHQDPASFKSLNRGLFFRLIYKKFH